jgi:hypothetical protein
MFIEILVEGYSDSISIKHILERGLNLQEDIDFRIHPHRGKGMLPKKINSKPNPLDRSLLHQLPAKLRGYSCLNDEYLILVVVDSDNENCRDLKSSLVEMYNNLDKKPQNVLFRIVVEECESWFLADPNAIRSAYPRAKIERVINYRPDTVIEAWEKLAETLGKKPNDCDGGDKLEWASRISPHLDLEDPKSPSLKALISGIRSFCNRSESG